MVTLSTKIKPSFIYRNKQMILARHELIASFFTRNYTLTDHFRDFRVQPVASRWWLNNRCGRRKKLAGVRSSRKQPQ